jgi:hypothetical protein
MTDLRKAAQAVLDRWDSPQWEWLEKGPTAVLMANLRKALAEPDAVLAEREACAKQLEALGNDHCAAAIRNRGARD